MIKIVFKFLLFIVYIIAISVGIFAIDYVGIIPSPDDFISPGVLNGVVSVVGVLLILALWIFMIVNAYKRVFKVR